MNISRLMLLGFIGFAGIQNGLKEFKSSMCSFDSTFKKRKEVVTVPQDIPVEQVEPDPLTEEEHN